MTMLVGIAYSPVGPYERDPPEVRAVRLDPLDTRVSFAILV
jgi:hypothetical protein